MTRINLLPWREELRQEKQKQFITILSLAVLLMLSILAAIHFQISNTIDYHKARNNYVQNEINLVNAQISEISELQKVRKSLIERMDVIQDLQGSRPSIVHLFSELVSTVPNGVFLKELSQSEGNIAIKGEAESNTRVSAYMRKLSQSEWLKDPNLEVITITDKKIKRVSSFTLSVKQTSPNSNDDNEEGGQI